MNVFSPSIDHKLHSNQNQSISSKESLSSNNMSIPAVPDRKVKEKPGHPQDKLSLSQTALSTLQQEQTQKTKLQKAVSPNSPELVIDEDLKYQILRNLFLLMTGEDYGIAVLQLPAKTDDESVEKLKSLINQAQVSIKGNSFVPKQGYTVQCKQAEAFQKDNFITYIGKGIIRTQDGQILDFDVTLNLNSQSAERYNRPVPGKEHWPDDLSLFDGSERISY